jgi:hypothetical protein|tara:strand:+ start:3140 stop:3598 length:459 start_codon:yes stop_codon:yes gene_type:complete
MRLIIAAALSLVCVAPAAAQDFTASPNYGTIRLAPGFSPDPHLVVVQAGGSIDVGSTLKNCSGFITSAPDLRLHWDGDGSLDLKVSVISNADTTLVINGPTGSWYCDDDGGDGANPSVTLSSVSGQYDIWIGTFTGDETRPAVLSISELSSF